MANQDPVDQMDLKELLVFQDKLVLLAHQEALEAQVQMEMQEHQDLMVLQGQVVL